MAHVYKEIRRQSVADDRGIINEGASGAAVAARIVTTVGGIITVILAMRFVLSLLGANRGNAFASFIYSASYPFVAPFFGLFNYQERLGVGRFEFETLIAIAFWGFVAWMIARFLTVGTRDGDNI